MAQHFDYSGIFNAPANSYSGLGDAIENYYKGYEMSHSPERLRQERQQRELANTQTSIQNKYLPSDYSSQIAHRIASTHGLNIDNQYKAQGYETDLAQKLLDYQAQQRDNNLVNQYLQNRQLLSNEDIESQLPGDIERMRQSGVPLPPGLQGNSNPMQQQGGQTALPQAQGQPGAPMQNPGFGASQGMTQDPLVASILRKRLGINAPTHHLTNDGEWATYDPLTGEITTQQVGRKPEQIKSAEVKATREEERKQKAKDDAVTAYQAESAKQPVLNGMLDLINSPAFNRSVGVGSSIQKLISNDPETQQVLGDFDVYAGDLVNQSSKIFPRLTQGEYTALQRQKAQKSDHPEATKAKVLTMAALSKANMQYQKEFLNALEETGDVVKADEIARDSVDMSEVKQTIRIDNNARNIASKTKADYGAIMQNARKISEETGLSVDEVLINFKDSLKNGKK